jgi:hypothetical protein
MTFYLSHYVALFILFFFLTPGILLTIPPAGTRATTALFHAIIFTILVFITNEYIMDKINININWNSNNTTYQW